MNKPTRLAEAALVGSGVALLALLGAGTASAQGTGSTTYTADLQPVPLNTPAGAASGYVTVTISGDQATVSEQVQGLAPSLPTSTATLNALGVPTAFAGKPFPHVQHIHINGMPSCPTAAADTNHDGLITVAEAAPDYGAIGTTLSETGTTAPSAAANVLVAPSGASFTYHRTFTMNQQTLSALKNNKAVVVVHGLNPANAPKAALTTPNSLGVTLPGASKKVAAIATAPALCGVLSVQQMGVMPSGAPQTGGGSTAGLQNEGLLAAGGGMVVLGGGLLLVRRRR